MIRLYPAEASYYPGHTIYGMGVPDCFGDIQLVPIAQVIYHAHSNQHDDSRLKLHQDPLAYRSLRIRPAADLGADDGPGLQGAAPAAIRPAGIPA